MKISKSLNKNFSINEHLKLIEKKYSKKEILNINNKESYCFKYNRYIYLPLFEDFEYNDSLLELNASFLKELIDKKIFNYGDSVYLRFLNKNNELFVFNDLENTKLKIDNKFIIKNELFDLEVYFDLNLIFLNYLNLKTINHFSKIIISKNKNIYFLKRKDWLSLFIINEELNK